MLTCIPPHLRGEVVPVLPPTPTRGQRVSTDAQRASELHHAPTFGRYTQHTAYDHEQSSADRQDEKRSLMWDVEKGDPVRDEQPQSSRRLNRAQIFALVLILVQTTLFALHKYRSGLSFSSTRPAPAGALAQLEPSFVERCDSLLVPPEGTFVSRLDRLSTVLQNDTVFVAEPSPSAAYYIGAFSSSDWGLSERPFLIVLAPGSTPNNSNNPTSSGSRSRVILLTPSFEALRASLIDLPHEIRQRVEWLEWAEDQSPYDVLSAHLGESKFVLDDKVRQFVGQGLRAVMKEHKGAIADDVRNLRERKSEREIGLLRCANHFTLHAIRQTRKRMYLGITESATSAILEEEMAKTGLVGGEGLVLFGENAALPHGSGTDRKLGKNDFVLIDAGGKFGGYVSDITRTFALPDSDIPKEHIELWETVRRAQLAPYTLLSSADKSLTFGELDKAARAVVTDWGSQFGSGEMLHTGDASPDFSLFTHRLGHGIGLEGHESPYLVQGVVGDRTPREGNVFSLEPGIYLPSSGGEVNGLRGVGVRLEDCFVLTRGSGEGWAGEWLSGPVEKWGDV